MRLTTSSPSCAEYHEIWEPKPNGTFWVTPGQLRDGFTFFFIKAHEGLKVDSCGRYIPTVRKIFFIPLQGLKSLSSLEYIYIYIYIYKHTKVKSLYSRMRDSS